MKRNYICRTLVSSGLCTALVLSALSVPVTAFAEEAAAQAVTLQSLKDLDIDSAWKHADAANYAELGDLDLLEVTQYLYVVSDSDVDYELESRMYEYGEPQDAASAEYGDLVTMDFSYVVDGEEFTEADFLIDVGYEEISPEFDEVLDGSKVGDEVTLTQTFGEEDALYSDWENQTVEMSGVITAIERTVYPTADDAWVAENTEYSTLEEYRAAISEELQSYYNEESQNDLLQSVINAAMEECTFNGYPQDLYDEAYDAILTQYQELADTWGMELEDLYESYGMDESQVANDAVDFVNYQMFLSAYANENNVSVTADEIADFAQTYYEGYGFENADELLSNFALSDIAYAVAEEKISAALLENANISIEEYNSENEDLLYEDESEADDEWEEFDLGDGAEIIVDSE